MIRLQHLTTVQIAEYLQKNVTKEQVLTDKNYIYLRELTYRQIDRINYRLNYKKRNDLAHTISSSILMYLCNVYPKGFKVSNWIKYTYNWTMRSMMAIYYPDGTEKHEIIEINDELELNNFIITYFYNAIEPLYFIDEIEAFEGLKNLHIALEECIYDIIKYKENHPKFSVIYNSVLFSILNERIIFLYGTTKSDKDYIKSLVNLVKKYLIFYIRKDLTTNDNTINEYITNLPKYLRYEEYEDEI